MVHLKNIAIRLIFTVSVLALIPNPGMGDALIAKGAKLPEMVMDAPPEKKDCSYLGIKQNAKFTLADVAADLIILEIIGVYCPQCHKQRPHINRLFHRIKKDAGLSSKVKFVGIAVGATPMEVAYLIKNSRIPYPVLTDEQFAYHKLLGEPRTPFNIVVKKDGTVLWTHLGIIADMNQFFATLKRLAGQ